ncbi:MAG: iron ABC transporter permease [Coriobacteriia bacterium]|nr:iron ABC transporter permease [Coriobacteriia bacterium]MBS5477528.1 iron ABC transporter permease [Coriobacteriia bacterium]
MAGEEQKDVAAGAPSDDTPGLVAGKVVPRHGAYEARRSSTVLATVISVAVLFALFVVSLGLGRAMIPPAEVLGILGQQFFGMQGDFSQGNVTIVINVRLPRICAAMLVGSALAIAGATYQGLFKNPMVSPDILGASAGASFGAALALLLTNGGGGIVETSAFVLGFVAVMLTYFSSKSIGHGTNMTLLLVLCGLIVGTLFQSFVSIIKYTADPDSKLPEITYWLMGSIAKVTWADLKIFLIPYVLGAVPLLLLRWRLNTLAFGDAEAVSLGVNVPLLRAILILCSTLLTAAVVAIAGVVGWVGLIIPHMVRFITGPDNRVVLPLSLVFGAGFLVIVDTACRTLMASEIPLGILTSIIGAPFFFFILLKTRKGGGEQI